MKKSDFYYDLPPELIAQTPLERRDASRLLTLDKRTGATEHHVFHELPDFLNEGDCLVMNDSRVIPARLFGTRPTGGSVEVVLLRDLGGGDWDCLTRPGRKTQPGTHIKEELTDKERYQTVYSRDPGSAAAPTAGLHFTPELLQRIADKGVSLAYVTLHVGLGTFRPVKEDNIEDHPMHAEFCIVSQETADIVNRTHANGGRVISVGTTSCRTLESFTGEDGILQPKSGWTDIFIYPGYRFKAIDALVTNFHLPESTLIMLVSALAGRENVLRAYEEAVKERYSYISFGDAIFIHKR